MKNIIQKSYVLLGKQTAKLPKIFLMFLLISVIDLVGIGIVAPFVGFILDNDMQINITYLYNNFLGSNISQQELIVLIGIFMLAFFSLRLVIAVAINGKIIGFAEEQRLRLKMSLLRVYQNMSIQDAVKRNSAEYAHLIHVLTGHYSGNVIFFLLKILSEVLIASIIIVFLAYKNSYLVFLLLILLILIVGGYDKLVRSHLKIIGEKINNSSITALARVRESIDGYKEIRVLGKENSFEEAVELSSKDIFKHTKEAAIISSVPKYLLEFVIFAFIIIACIASKSIVNDPNEFILTMVLFGAAAIRLVPSATLVSHGVTVIRANEDSVDLLYKDFIASKPKKNNSLSPQEIDIGSFKSIKIRNINFAYDEELTEIFSDFSLEIKKGDSIGMMGTSGSGKSTLIDLILGMLEPQKGLILINDTPINSCQTQWWAKVAYIPQEIFLIDATIEENIALNFNNEKINNEKINEAIRMASLDKLVSSLSDGIKTKISENGANLSGGQRQRIALARAFYHEREFLIMDEATSALDADTERNIVDEIVKLNKNLTVVIIAHRESTIRNCNLVIKLDQGKIIKKGPPSKFLLNSN